MGDKNTSEVRNGGGEAVATGTALSFLRGHKGNVSDTTYGLRSGIGVGKSAVQFSNAAQLALSGNYGDAANEAIMGTTDLAKSVGLEQKIIEKVEQTKLAGSIIAKTSPILSTAQAAPLIGMAITGVAAATAETKEQANGTMLIGACRTLGAIVGGVAGGSAGTLVPIPIVGTVSGAAAGATVFSETMAESCANFWAYVSPSHEKLVGSLTVAMANGMKIPELYNEGEKLTASGVTYTENVISGVVSEAAKKDMANLPNPAQLNHGSKILPSHP